MKIFLSLLLIFLFSGIESRKCISRSVGAVCDPKVYNSCQLGYYCNDQTNICQRLKENGEDCNFDFQCLSHLSCSENKCVSNKYLGVGESCKENIDCTYGLVCNSMTTLCENPKYPSCESTDGCSSGEFCDRESESCKSKLKENQECFRHHFGNCESGLECILINSENATCQRLFSKQEGDYCQSFTSCDISKSLMCSSDLKCRVYEPTILPTNSSCESSSCAIGVEACYCDPLKNGQSSCKSYINYNDQCLKAKQSLEECKKTNPCPDVYNFNDPKSCYQSKCSPIIEQVQIKCFN